MAASGGAEVDESAAGQGGIGGAAHTGKAGAAQAGDAQAGDAQAGDAQAGARNGCGGTIGQQSVLERGNNPARTAHFIQPQLRTVDVARMTLDTNFRADFPGHMLAVPLYLEPKDCAENGLFIAVTLENDVFALDEKSGEIVWRRNIGVPAGEGYGPGVISRGIMSTPVIDPISRVIYVVGGIGPGNLERHEIHALSADTGAEVPGPWPIDVSKVKAGEVRFNPSGQHQRSALSLVQGVLYVAFGGNGDSPVYRGWVVAVDTDDPRKVSGWATLGLNEGIWAPGGMPSDGDGVFAVTGNGRLATGDHSDSDSEEVIRITDDATPHRDDNNRFVPTVWRQMDQADLDFSASSPLIVRVPMSVPDTLLVAPSKAGHIYFLDAKHLGGIGGELRDLLVGDPTAESMFTVPTAYSTDQGVHLAVNVSLGAPCPGGTLHYALVGIALHPGNPPVPQVAWCAKVANDAEVGRRSPISTTTDGHSNAAVWFMNGTKLNAFDGGTGEILFAGGAEDCMGVHRFTSPIAVNGRIVVGADGHLCSWSVHEAAN